MTANVITYRGRSAAREVGKALGLDQALVDRLAKVMNQFEFVDPDDTHRPQLAAAGLDAGDRRVQHFARLWQQMQDLPRHLGQHSGGMVICQGELSSVVPLENASMPGRVVVQWDKDDCADMGLIKVDLLGLGMMAVLQDAIRLVNAMPVSRQLGTRQCGSTGTDPRRNAQNCRTRLRTVEPAPTPPVSISPIFPQTIPPSTRCCRRPTPIGVFQVESRAQMATLPRLKPTCFYDLVVQVAIIRPGPIVGQMVHPYLNRRAGREPVGLRPPAARADAEAHARRAAVPGAAAAHGDGRRRVHRRPGRGAAPRDGLQAIREEDEAARSALLREGMAKNGITGEAADRIVLSITSFALYGFPESHAASFALIAYASAYLKVHYPAAFYTALLNNQPMGFYHPATLVKDAQRRGVRFAPIDVQVSDWDCTVKDDGTIRLGPALRQRIARGGRKGDCRAPTGVGKRESRSRKSTARSRVACPKCGCDDASMIEGSGRRPTPDSADSRLPIRQCFCNVCSHQWVGGGRRSGASARSTIWCASSACAATRSTMLAEIGALNSFGLDRRSALWQVERAVRPAGELFEEAEAAALEPSRLNRHAQSESPIANQQSSISHQSAIGNRAMDAAAQPAASDDAEERLVADYAGTGLTIGPHPMTFRRHELSMRGVLRAIDLPRARTGRRVRTAGMVITRQRPGTAKGFVFLTLEDETGVANIIVRPDFYATTRLMVIESPFLLVEGMLQTEDGVTSIRAERVQRLEGLSEDSGRVARLSLTA